MAENLVVCGACSAHVKVVDSRCPHCGASMRGGVVGRTAGAVLMGLTLAGCPAGDDTSETLGNGDTGSSSTNPGTSAMGTSTSGVDVSTGDVGPGPTSGPGPGSDPAYGNPATDTFGTTDMTASDTGTGTGTGTDSGTGTGTGTGGDSSSSSSSG